MGVFRFIFARKSIESDTPCLLFTKVVVTPIFITPIQVQLLVTLQSKLTQHATNKKSVTS
jgi:hypothetical protein